MAGCFGFVWDDYYYYFYCHQDVSQVYFIEEKNRNRLIRAVISQIAHTYFNIKNYSKNSWFWAKSFFEVLRIKVVNKFQKESYENKWHK